MTTDDTNSKTSNQLLKAFGGIYPEVIERLAVPFPSFQTNHWNLFDEYVGGFRTREFSILCAPTGVGKTQWLASLSALFLKQRIRHFIASVETGPHDFVTRVMSVMCGTDLNTGKPVSTDALKEFDQRYGDYFRDDMGLLSLHENRISIEDLLSDLGTVASMGYSIAILDNLNFFLDIVTANQSIVEMDRVIHELIMFCKRTDIHIVMVMHPKKTADGRVTSEFDIKGSSTAVQEAHNVFLLNRPSTEQVALGRDKTHRELTITKLRRRGLYVGRTIWYKYEGGRYSETV